MHIIKQWYYSYKINSFTSSLNKNKNKLNTEDKKTKKIYFEFQTFLDNNNKTKYISLEKLNYHLDKINQLNLNNNDKVRTIKDKIEKIIEARMPNWRRVTQTAATSVLQHFISPPAQNSSQSKKNAKPASRFPRQSQPVAAPMPAKREVSSSVASQSKEKSSETNAQSSTAVGLGVPPPPPPPLSGQGIAKPIVADQRFNGEPTWLPLNASSVFSSPKNRREFVASLPEKIKEFSKEEKEKIIKEFRDSIFNELSESQKASVAEALRNNEVTPQVLLFLGAYQLKRIIEKTEEFFTLQSDISAINTDYITKPQAELAKLEKILLKFQNALSENQPTVEFVHSSGNIVEYYSEEERNRRNQFLSTLNKIPEHFVISQNVIAAIIGKIKELKSGINEAEESIKNKKAEQKKIHAEIGSEIETEQLQKVLDARKKIVISLEAEYNAKKQPSASIKTTNSKSKITKEDAQQSEIELPAHLKLSPQIQQNAKINPLSLMKDLELSEE